MPALNTLANLCRLLDLDANYILCIGDDDLADCLSAYMTAAEFEITLAFAKLLLYNLSTKLYS